MKIVNYIDDCNSTAEAIRSEGKDRGADIKKDSAQPLLYLIGNEQTEVDYPINCSHGIV